MEENASTRLVAIAFSATGLSPKQGGRISELIAIERVGDQSAGRVLRLYFKTEETQLGKKTFSEQFELLDEMIGDSQIILYNAGIWRRFIREELRIIRKRSARRLLKQVIEVEFLVRKRFPRQRKDLASILKKLRIEEPPELDVLRRDAESLLLIASEMKIISGKINSENQAIGADSPRVILQKSPAPMTENEKTSALKDGRGVTSEDKGWPSWGVNFLIHCWRALLRR